MNNHQTFPIYYWIECIDAYQLPHEQENWLPCPRCKLRPKVWVFDNGRSTACGCAENRYNHWSIFAESICSVYKRAGSTLEYNPEELKNNWNNYCETGEIIFERQREDGRW